MQGDADWPGKLPAEVEAFILATAEMLHELDDTGLHELAPCCVSVSQSQYRVLTGEEWAPIGPLLPSSAGGWGLRLSRNARSPCARSRISLSSSVDRSLKSKWIELWRR